MASQQGLPNKDALLLGYANPNAVVKLPGAMQDNAKIGANSEGSDSTELSSTSPLRNSIPLGNGRQNSLDESSSVRIGILKREGANVYCAITFPTTTSIISIIPETNNESTKIVRQIASIYNSTEGFVFNEEFQFPPGDYCLALTCSNKDETKQITGLRLLIRHETISNFVLSQMFCGLSRSLGFEPSHIMNYPSKAVNPAVPFYRKMRSEMTSEFSKLSGKITGTNLSEVDQLIQTQTKTIIDELKKYEKLVSLVAQINQISTMMGEVSTHIREMGRNEALVQEQTKAIQEGVISLNEAVKDIHKNASENSSMDKNIRSLQEQLAQVRESFENRQSQEKGSDAQTITVADLEKLVAERKLFYERLVEAEDFIDEMGHQK